MRGQLFTCAAIFYAALTVPLSSIAQKPPAATSVVTQVATMPNAPVMGWNSWDSYGLSIDEDEFVSTTDILHLQLQQYGWTYAVIDEGWYLANPESDGKPEWQYTVDGQGRYIPDLTRFPSAADGVGFKKLPTSCTRANCSLVFTSSVGFQKRHGQKSAHPPTRVPRHGCSRYCGYLPLESRQLRRRDNAAGQAYYDSLIRLYAGWGVDFLKVDCIAAPYKAAEIRMIHNAIEKSGRPIVLSLSPGRRD